jgi:hypothetical protein
MRRRSFITFAGIAAIGWPLAAYGHQASKIYRLVALARVPHLIEALQAGLRELGYVEGKRLAADNASVPHIACRRSGRGWLRSLPRTALTSGSDQIEEKTSLFMIPTVNRY